MTTVRITLQPPGGSEADIDMSRVLYRTAFFTMAVNSVPGEFYLQIRDTGHTENFVSGTIVRLYIDGTVRFGGFLMSFERTWPLPVMDSTVPTQTVRYWTLRGADWNILWQRRITFDPAHPTTPYKYYPVGTYDDTILLDVLANYSDISEVCPSHSIARVGVVILDIPANAATKWSPGGAPPWQSGSTLAEAFSTCTGATGAIYYIDAAGVITYCDVETTDSAFALTDIPSAAGDIGYRSMKIENMGDQLCNDSLVWGAALGSSNMVISRTTDDASIAGHGRWQRGLYSAGLYRQTSSDLMSSSMVYGTPSSLRGAKDDKVSFSVTVNGAPFSVGEKVRCQSNVFGFDRILPVRKASYRFPTPTDVISELTMTYEVDTSWSIFESRPLDPITITIPPVPIPPLPPIPPAVFLDTFTRADQSGWGYATPTGQLWADDAGGGVYDAAIVSDRGYLPAGPVVASGYPANPYISNATQFVTPWSGDHILPEVGTLVMNFFFSQSEWFSLNALDHGLRSWQIGVLRGIQYNSVFPSGVLLSVERGAQPDGTVQRLSLYAYDPGGGTAGFYDLDAYVFDGPFTLKVQWSASGTQAKCWPTAGSEPGWQIDTYWRPYTGPSFRTDFNLLLSGGVASY